MAVQIVSSGDVPLEQRNGRTLRWLATEALGSQQVSLAIMECPVGSVARPLHAHRDVEEIVYVAEGQGDAWVDGEIGAFVAGDLIVFPPNSKHMVRNTGDTPLVTVCVFGVADAAATYVLCDGEGGW